ncbi:hypothetical protein ILYODFUR_036875 [Ilyodon furcidens]|uniref:Uncharacterized protein n=1 Tax=Ilyodon furcidens TaxID=33524 RepID=A0ABV0VN41_9TELE
MSYKIVSALASVFAFTTWTYYYPKDEVTNEKKVNVLSLTERPSQRHEEDETNKFKEQLMFTVEVKPECKPEPGKIILHPNQTDQLLFTSAVMFLSGSFPIGNVFILLLIHTCGGEVSF